MVSAPAGAVAWVTHKNFVSGGVAVEHRAARHLRHGGDGHAVRRLAPSRRSCRRPPPDEDPHKAVLLASTIRPQSEPRPPHLHREWTTSTAETTAARPTDDRPSGSTQLCVISFDRVLCMIGVHIILIIGHSTAARSGPLVPIGLQSNGRLCARAIVCKSQSTLQGWPASGHALAGWPRA